MEEGEKRNGGEEARGGGREREERRGQLDPGRQHKS